MTTRPLSTADAFAHNSAHYLLRAVADGVSRPGALERHVQGISTKVLSERLRKLTNYGLLAKLVYAEVPPRTEYSLTQNGLKLVGIIDQLTLLDGEMKSADRGTPADPRKAARRQAR